MADRGVSSGLRHRSSTLDLAHRDGFVGAVARFWTKSYAPDYLAILIIFVSFVLIQFFVTPFHRLFVLSDLAISYPHAEIEHVSPTALLLYSLAFPIIFFAIWAVITRPSAHKARVTYLGLILSVFLTALLTDIIKNAVGRPRPDLLARCRPKPGTPRNSLVDWHVCTQTDHHALHDGWRSFPSGHSSFAFSGLGYVALFIAAQTHALNPATPLIVSLLPLVPLFGALLIAISRTEDYRHDVWDVTAGSLLGILIAWASWRRYHPRLQCARPDVPYVARGEMFDGVKKREKRSDEEETLALREDELDDVDADDDEDPRRRIMSGANYDSR